MSETNTKNVTPNKSRLHQRILLVAAWIILTYPSLASAIGLG